MDSTGTGKEVEDETRDDQQPSTSTGLSSNATTKDDEMSRLLQATDEILENKAKSMNLSSLNVRSILHHLIKYPSAIDVLLGIQEDENLPSVRNTRSRKKPDDSGPSSAVQTPKKFALRIEDKGPKNFLDLEYEEDDEFDADYVEEEGGKDAKGDAGTEEDEDDYDDDDIEDEEEENEEEESFGEEIPAATGTADKSFPTHDTSLNTLLFEEEQPENFHITLNDTVRPDSTAPVATLDTVVDDEDYAYFVKSLKFPADDSGQQPDDDDDDEEDDEDYNVIADILNVEDWDETRQDKTTMIPRHEVKALMMDTLLAEREIPINVIPDDVMIIGEDHRQKTQKARDAEVCERLNTSATSSSTESCSLIRPCMSIVSFRLEEFQLLQEQLQQHVQLLTQFVVTCHHDPELSHVRNSAQIMMNSLDDERHSKMYPTIFNIPNLDSAIESCHDINAFPEVDLELLPWSKDTEGFSGTAIRPEAAAVLSRSRAICFPDLLPPVQPVFIEKPIPFLHEENLMLALALLQFAHLPRRAEKGCLDRYTAIAQHCLPARSAYKIRSHLKTMRRVGTNPSPIHLIIQAAEQGISNLSVPKKHWSTCADAIATWPVESQPKWFRLFHKKFVVTEDRQIHTKTSSKIYLTPVKTGSKTTVERNDIKVEEEEYVEVGKGPSGQSVVLDREHLEQLVMQLLKEKEVSPSKRRKNSTPQKLTQLAELATILSNEESCSEIETPARRKVGGRETISPTPPPKSQSLEPDGASCYSTQFPIPPTPGRRTPNEDDDLFMDLESNSLMWLQTPHAVVVPDEASVAPIDFSSLTYSSSGAIAACQVPMGMLGSEFGAAEYSNSSQRHVSESMDEETSLTGFDIVPPDEEEEVEIEVQTKVMITRPPLRTKLDDPNQRASRKRTRHERETMGATGLDNTFLISQQNNVVARKILEDVKQRLFMHTETWERLKSAMKDPKIEDYDKTLKISEILRHHRELLHLILLYAPPESLSVELFNDPRFQSTRAAMEMILVIERYVTCAKLKEPSVRSVFRYIRSFLDEQPDLSGEQAAARFFQLLGQDRPLWKRLEQNFWCLAFGKKPKIEQFEYVDLSGVEKLTSRRKDKKIQNKCSSNFETIDEINEVMPSAYRLQKCAEPNNLVVKCGELCVRNDTDDSYTQLEISERQWTRKDDITLLTRFNDALKSNPAFSEEQTPSLVPELQFGAKSVVARLRYLLAELRSQSNM